MFVLLSIIVFIIILALLVLVHEWGHFKAARKFGIRVDEFGFGFPPRIWKKKFGETEYSINWIPLGGFVKIFGEDREGEGSPDSFISKPVWQRMVVVLAGVFMNWVLAFVLLTVGFLYGLPREVNEQNIDRARDVSVIVSQVFPDSPAQKAGISIGDSIYKLSYKDDSVLVSDIKDVQEFVGKYKGEEVVVQVKRGENIESIVVTPRKEVGENEGPMGIALAKVGIVSSVWYEAPIEGAKATLVYTAVFVAGFYDILKNLITQGNAGAELAGPLGIGQLTYQFTQLGLPYLIQFAAILSINLAIINLFPIPALDGGRFVFLLIEAVKRSPVPKKVEMAFQTIGVLLLILLMIWVTIKDIARLF